MSFKLRVCSISDKYTGWWWIMHLLRNNTGTKSNQVKCSHVSVSRQRRGGKQPDMVGKSCLGVLNECTVGARPGAPPIMHIYISAVQQNEAWYSVILSERTRGDVHELTWAIFLVVCTLRSRAQVRVVGTKFVDLEPSQATNGEPQVLVLARDVGPFDKALGLVCDGKTL